MWASTLSVLITVGPIHGVLQSQSTQEYLLNEWKKLDKHLNSFLFETLSSLGFQNTTLQVFLLSLRLLVS